MRIIKQRTHHQDVTYLLNFVYVDHPTAGFSFPCDKLGSVNEAKMSVEGRKNYNACLAGAVRMLNDGLVVVTPVINKGVESYPNRWVEPAIGECDRCGSEVSLDGFTNTCANCHADYNQSGQLLGPRSDWGSETNEHLSDILNIDSCSTDALF